MVLQPLLSTRFVALSLAVSALMFSQTISAATIGKTDINSKQHEPLSATIDVSDIDPDSFSVSIANKRLYQQMGMSADIPMNVRFEKTSNSTGKLILSSSQPVSEPFADVVLVVNDKGRAQSLPKTLLLPAGKASPSSVARQTTVGTSSKPALPEVSAMQKPTEPKPPAQQQSAEQRLPNKQILVTRETTTIRALTDDNNNLNASNNITKTTENNVEVTSQLPSETSKLPDELDFFKAENNKPSPANTAGPTTKAETLETQIKRTYKTLDGEIKATKVIKDEDNLKQPSAITPATQNTPNKLAQTQADSELKADATTAKNSKKSDANADVPLGEATYKVQRNDNLWTIALQISEKNDVDVFTVMEQIQAYNPDAFINGNKSQLRANVQLSLPAYEVIPSKLGMRAALEAKKAQKKRSSDKNTIAKANKNTGKNKTNTTAKANRPKSSVNKPLPKPHLKLVTPSKKGQATGTARTGTADNDNLNASLIASLETARKRAAAQARLVSGINESLAERTRKLKLHNQKLASLENRLKKLRNK